MARYNELESTRLGEFSKLTPTGRTVVDVTQLLKSSKVRQTLRELSERVREAALRAPQNTQEPTKSVRDAG